MRGAFGGDFACGPADILGIIGEAMPRQPNSRLPEVMRRAPCSNTSLAARSQAAAWEAARSARDGLALLSSIRHQNVTGFPRMTSGWRGRWAQRQGYRHSGAMTLRVSPTLSGRLLDGAQDFHVLSCSRRSPCRRGTFAWRPGRRRHRADDRCGLVLTCGAGAPTWANLVRTGDVIDVVDGVRSSRRSKDSVAVWDRPRSRMRARLASLP